VYESLLRPLLFSLDPERAHDLTMGALSMAPAWWARSRRAAAGAERPSLTSTVAGVTFPNPIGLAAGLDKNAHALTGLFGLGFGFVEVGTVTPRPQPGNPKPRMFRIPERQAIINRLGFNNLGATALKERLEAQHWRPAPIGVNIGKNKDTPNERAVEDYVACAKTVGPLGDYVVVNLSSPNTPGLRELQEPQALEAILRAVHAELAGRPLFLKIAPDLGDEAVDAVVDVARSTGIAGLICTNTTITRPFEHPVAKEAGGLSGRPVFPRSTEVLRRAFKRSDGRLPLIGVGGVFDADDAFAKLCAGASLVQLYTGFVYGGPATPRRMLDGLERRLAKQQLTMATALGRDA
jgi:dihydroorotate dehydrogenase